MAKQAVIELCYTDTDVTTAVTKWGDLGYTPVHGPTDPYADVAVYERKNGVHRQLPEQFGGKQPVLIVFEG